MKIHALFASVLVSTAFVAFADESPAPPAAETPAPAQQPAAPRPARRALPPEAFTTPTNFVVLVVLSGEVRLGRG